MARIYLSDTIEQTWTQPEHQTFVTLAERIEDYLASQPMAMNEPADIPSPLPQEADMASHFDPRFTDIPYDCPVHGDLNIRQNFDTHYESPLSCYKETLYGFACAACGWRNHDVPKMEDEAHGELCCGKMICTENHCMTHNFF